MWLIPLAGVLALLYAFSRTRWVAKQPAGTDLMVEISDAIAEGARAFLRREYRVLVVFVFAVGALLAVANMNETYSSWLIAVSFGTGALCSGLAGFIGMTVATKANVRTTHAARTGLSPALNVAFSGGLVMGLCVVGLGVLGLGTLFLIYSNLDWTMAKVINVISGFSLGASSIALFARVGGGIYTKAADVGADLAGKVYEGIPEDDPRNGAGRSVHPGARAAGRDAPRRGAASADARGRRRHRVHHRFLLRQGEGGGQPADGAQHR